MENPPSWLKPLLPPSGKEVAKLQALKEKKEKSPEPAAPPLVLQGGTDLELLFPPSHQPSPRGTPVPQSLPGPAPGPEGSHWSPPHTRHRALHRLTTDSTVLPLRAAGPLMEQTPPNQPHHYWPFTTSDLYNWKMQNPKFSEKPTALIDLLDSILFTHQPTWDDCHQLLQVLFTTEEQNCILAEARKAVEDADGRPTTNQALIHAAFPFTRPDWDFNMGTGQLQTLSASCRE
ncbi:uncharacterized protein LOC128575900 isoform X2 [Nycticebus coucang]|uniref:uncharacterized protein LOC128575900 isoform X2 n=1 Tax=Nycticebus coucang TaxID=9470 RepID=UPI00234DE811|nr:uncharacterized protein LOC128575900 isoform X2 [Nycticebus coucang]